MAVNLLNFLREHSIPLCTGNIDIPRWVVQDVPHWTLTNYRDYSSASTIESSGTLVYHDFADDYSRPLTAVSNNSLSLLRCRFSSAALRLAALHLCAACSFAAAKQVPLMNQSKMHNRGQAVVVQEGLNRVVLLSKANPEDRTIINVGEKPHEVELSLDGRTAYVLRHEDESNDPS